MKINYAFIIALCLSSLGFSQEKVEVVKERKASSVQRAKEFWISRPASDFPQMTAKDRAKLEGKIVPRNGIYGTENLSEKRQKKLDWIRSAGESKTQVDGLLDPNQAKTHEGRAPIVNFDGISLNVSPPDPSMAVGPNHIVTMENGQWAVYNKSGVMAAGFPKALNVPLQAPGATVSAGDPVVMYDRVADRWFISQFQLPYGNTFLIGVSKTPDPTGAYYVYKYDVAENDYPHYGIWGDSYVAAGNFTGDKVYAWNRTKMLAGDASAEMVKFTPPNLAGTGFIAPMPVHSERAGAATGPAKVLFYQDNAFSGVSTDHVGLWNVNLNWSNPASSTISAKQEIPLAAFDAVFAGGFANIAQPGTSQRIDVIMGAVMNMAHWYKFPTHESIIFNFPVETVDGSLISGIRWVELRSTNGGTSWTKYQEGTFTDPSGSESVWMGCMSMDKNGSIGLGYTKSGTTTYPSLYHTGRKATDELGKMTVAETEVVKGTTSVTSNPRYGDYGQGVTDPSDDLTFWVTSEYSGEPRKVRVYSYKIDVPMSINEFEANKPEVVIYNSGNNNFNVEVKSQKDLGELTIEVINVTGQKIFSTPIEFANGKYAKQLNLASQAAGVYFVKIGKDGSQETRKIMVK